MQGTYYESAEDVTISQDRALREIADHGHTSDEAVAEFFTEMGDQAAYRAQDVLDWLGY